MSEFHDLIDTLLGDSEVLSDVSVVVRRLWFYDFDGTPVRLWDGKGKLFTTDDNEWLGTIDQNDTNHHKTPAIQDGRDGTSATYEFELQIPSLPGEASPRELYESIKADQTLAVGRKLTCYLAVFQEGEALRPATPISFLKELTMFSPRFSESVEYEMDRMVRRYKITLPCKDANFGRSNVPNGTYADTMQKRRAAELGVSVDKGAEYLALLANRTMQIP